MSTTAELPTIRPTEAEEKALADAMRAIAKVTILPGTFNSQAKSKRPKRPPVIPTGDNLKF